MNEPKIIPLYKLWIEVEVTNDLDEYDHEEILEPYCLGHYSSAAALLIVMSNILEDVGEYSQRDELHSLNPKQIDHNAIKMLKAQDEPT